MAIACSRHPLSAATLLLLAAFLAGCDSDAATTPPPAPSVTVSRPMLREVIEWDEYTGHLESPAMVNLQARVSGFIEQAHFQEGALVHKGDVLFVIDDRSFRADLDSKEADVAKAISQEELAEVHMKRFEKVHGTKAISDEDYDTAKASLSQAQSVVAGAKAAAELARLNLEWTRVVAPISGRISRKYVTEGNLVNGGVGQATLLTTISSVDPIYCYVDVDERTILKYQRLAQEKKRVSARDAQIPAFMQLENETTFPHEGVVDFVDNKVDPGTGTLRARGVFPNKNGYLTPGFFGRMRAPGSGRYKALLVPDSAIGTDQNIKFLLVVKADNTVDLRPVKLGALFGTLRSIEEGIGPNDRVITNGTQLARPGAKVAPNEVPIPASLFIGTAPGSAATQALPEAHAPPATGPTTGESAP